MNFNCKSFGLLFMFVALLFATDLDAQTAKKFFKTGEDFVEAENYEDAIEQFTKAIELESDFEDAYLERAKAKEKISKLAEAAEDYNRLTAIDPKESEYFYNEGRLYAQLEKFQESILPLSKAIEINKKYHDAIQLRSKSYIKLDSFKTAIRDCDLAIEVEKKESRELLQPSSCE